LSCNPPTSKPSNLPVNYTGIADTGASGIYFTKNTPVNYHNTSAPNICVGIADGTIVRSSASAQLKLMNLPPSARQGHIMPTFTRTLFGIAPLCNANLTVIFTKHDVKAINQAGAPILEGWRDPGRARDWHFPIVNANCNSNEDSLFPSDDELTSIPPPDPPPEPLPPPAISVPATYNSNKDSLFPSDDKLTSIPPPNPPPEPIPLPATPVLNTYWDRIKNERQPASLVQLTYRQQLD
jgi:hypothetical protein